MASVNLVNGNVKPALTNSPGTITDSTEAKMDMFSDTWGFNLEELYKISVVFFKGNVYKCPVGVTVEPVHSVTGRNYRVAFTDRVLTVFLRCWRTISS